MFEVQSYVTLNPDLASLGNDRTKLFDHFDRFGYLEQRTMCQEFDPLAYVALHEDVRNTKVNPYIHYLRYGWIEGRETSIPRNDSVNAARSTSSSRPISATRIVLSSGHHLAPDRPSGHPDDPYGLNEEALGVLVARSNRLSTLEDKWNVLNGTAREYEEKITELRRELRSARNDMVAAELELSEAEKMMRELQHASSSLRARVEALERSRSVRFASFTRRLFHGSA